MSDLYLILLENRELLFLFLGGFFIGIFSVIIGGGMFFSVPFLQYLFPEVSFGVIIGNLKIGSFFRSIGSTYSTHGKIQYLKNLKIGTLAFLGTLVGTSLIAQLNQKWLFPAVVMAIFLAIIAPKIAKKINKKTFHIASFLVGIYAGIFGAGIGILLIALLRLKYPKNTDIAFVKIQARFLELLLVISAVIIHIYYQNLISSIWIPWSFGALFGGLIGGSLLKKIGYLSGNLQKIILYIAFSFALFVAGIKFWIG